MKKILLATLILCSCSTTKKILYVQHLASEGDFVMLGNPSFAKYIKNDLVSADLLQLEKILSHSLEIPITPQGFVQAANRSDKEEGDETNYDAVWVRDSVWVYFSLLETSKNEKARNLILSLWDYYSSPDQVARFEKNIKDPKLAYEGGMNVPHIRFDSKSPEFKDVTKDGKPEEWNHRQNDAHGLFLLGIAEGYKQGIIKIADFTPSRKSSLNLFVPYLDAIKYWNFPDAGAWEEISKVNTSSVAMVVRALESWEDLPKLVKWNPTLVQKLIKHGYVRIRKNLNAGGESPDHDEFSPNYRREDAALFNLFLPHPLKKLSDAEKLLGLTILEKLIRPYGVIRYPLDSYQAGNYWVKEQTVEGLPDLTGDSSSSSSFGARFKQFIPSTEAQWFFDSKLSMIYLQFAEKDKKYLRLAKLHFKRALGQVTPRDGVV
jgi:hypothetical protein